jgi:hypothetical protein
MTEDFNKWWDSDGLVEDNPYGRDTPAFWAWEGWQAGVEAEREKVAQWMMQHGYATGHGDTTEDLLAELDWQIVDGWNRAMINGVKTEREACAGISEADAVGDDPACCTNTGYRIAAAIRARGQE